MRFALFLLLILSAATPILFTAAAALAHPFHLDELGFVHGSMHALGLESHSDWLSPALRMMFDTLVISLGAILAISPRMRTSVRFLGAAAAFVFLAV